MVAASRSCRMVVTALAAMLFALMVVVAPAQAAQSSRAASLDRSLVDTAKKLSACLDRGRSSRCRALDRRLQKTARRATSASRPTNRTAKVRPARSTPKLKRRGTKVTWSRAKGTAGYILARKATARSTQYRVTTKRSAPAHASDGRSAIYTVRAIAYRSRWSQRVVVRPSAKRRPAAPAPAPSPVAAAPTTSAPEASPAPSVATPVASAPAPAAPAPAPAPAAPGLVPAPEPAPTPAPAAPGSRPFEAGVVAGSSLIYELPFLRTLGARGARMEFDINAPISEIAPAVEAYARAGVRPLLLAGFHGRIPTAADASKLGAWAATFGPGGTFWVGKGLPESVQPTHIEYGNESSYSYQYPTIANNPDWAKTSFYADLAKQYGLTFKVAALAVRDANPRMDVLAIGEAPGGWPQWLDNIYSAVPDFDSYVGGFTVHPYGPNWQKRLDTVVEQTADHGAAQVPFYITEVGVSSDAGRCLSDNYGWDKCQTYAQAGATLTGEINGMRARYGSRLAGVWLYQAHDQQAARTTTDREHYFGGLTSTGAEKGELTDAYRSILDA